MQEAVCVRRKVSALIAILALVASAGCTSSASVGKSPAPAVPSPAVTASAPASTPSPSSAPSIPIASPSASAYPRLPIPPGTTRCRVWQLEVAFVVEGAAAGNVAVDFEMRNPSTTACWVYGYVGFQMLDRNGRPLPETLTRSTESFFGRSEPPTRILLPSGTAPLGSGNGAGHAFFRIATDDVLCGPEQVDATASLEIWPPDEPGVLIIPAQLPGGIGFVSCGRIVLSPLQGAWTRAPNPG